MPTPRLSPTDHPTLYDFTHGSRSCCTSTHDSFLMSPASLLPVLLVAQPPAHGTRVGFTDTCPQLARVIFCLCWCGGRVWKLLTNPLFFLAKTSHHDNPSTCSHLNNNTRSEPRSREINLVRVVDRRGTRVETPLQSRWTA